MARFFMVKTRTQWARAARSRTSFDARRVEMTLAWAKEERPALEGSAAGGVLAFDSGLRLYHLTPPGEIRRYTWIDGVAEPLDGGKPWSLFRGKRSVDFVPESATRPKTLVDMVIDGDDRMTLAGVDAKGQGWLWIRNLQEKRLLRQIPLPAPPRALALQGERLSCVVGAGELLQLTPASAVEPTGSLDLEQPLGAEERVRLLFGAGRAFLLRHCGQPQARLHLLGVRDDRGARISGEAPLATGATLLPDDVIAVALGAGQDLCCFDARVYLEPRPPLRAWGYEGSGVVTTPDGVVGYITAEGTRHAFQAPVRYARRGYIHLPRLDGEEFQTRWGRILLDVSLPEGAEIRLRCHASDEPDADADALPADVAADRGEDAAEEPEGFQPLYPRPTGPERPFLRARDSEITLEAPIRAPRGRYLFVTLQLRGATRRSPRVREVRAEIGHDWNERLPAIFSRDAEGADYLHRYLAPAAGFMDELSARAAARHTLLDPEAAPREALPWLASLLGLTLDERWSDEQSRRLLAAGTELLRRRGTVEGLRQLLEIYTGGPVRVLEHHRLQGGTSIVGDGLLGAGLQAAAPRDRGDLGEARAHRCTLLLLAPLGGEQRAAVAHLVAQHRPAHVVCDVFSADTGMIVGRGARIGMTAIVGEGGRYRRHQVGVPALGRDLLLGQASSALQADLAYDGWRPLAPEQTAEPQVAAQREPEKEETGW